VNPGVSFHPLADLELNEATNFNLQAQPAQLSRQTEDQRSSGVASPPARKFRSGAELPDNESPRSDPRPRVTILETCEGVKRPRQSPSTEAS
jgi:hypothetical protein